MPNTAVCGGLEAYSTLLGDGTINKHHPPILTELSRHSQHKVSPSPRFTKHPNYPSSLI